MSGGPCLVSSAPDSMSNSATFSTYSDDVEPSVPNSAASYFQSDMDSSGPKSVAYSQYSSHLEADNSVTYSKYSDGMESNDAPTVDVQDMEMAAMAMDENNSNSLVLEATMSPSPSGRMFSDADLMPQVKGLVFKPGMDFKTQQPSQMEQTNICKVSISNTNLYVQPC